MKEVFVTENTGRGQRWKVIDKKTNKVIGNANDVLIFNGQYKKFNNVRGWHGILSDQVNSEVIKVLNFRYGILVQHNEPYYPRLVNTEYPVRSAGIIKFDKFNHSCFAPNDEYSSLQVKNFTCSWKEEQEQKARDMEEDGLDEAGYCNDPNCETCHPYEEE